MTPEEILEELESWLISGILDIKSLKEFEFQVGRRGSDEYKRLESKEGTLKMVQGKIAELKR